MKIEKTYYISNANELFDVMYLGNFGELFKNEPNKNKDIIKVGEFINYNTPSQINLQEFFTYKEMLDNNKQLKFTLFNMNTCKQSEFDNLNNDYYILNNCKSQELYNALKSKQVKKFVGEVNLTNLTKNIRINIINDILNNEQNIFMMNYNNNELTINDKDILSEYEEVI